MKPHEGMTADEVLKMKPEDHIVQNPKVMGEDENGLIVEWYYPDCTLVLRRWNGRYRVAEVRENG